MINYREIMNDLEARMRVCSDMDTYTLRRAMSVFEDWVRDSFMQFGQSSQIDLQYLDLEKDSEGLRKHMDQKAAYQLGVSLMENGCVDTDVGNGQDKGHYNRFVEERRHSVLAYRFKKEK